MIYATSDLHGNLLDPPADATALLIAGDICPDFLRNITTHPHGPTNTLAVSSGATEQADWLAHEFRGWLESHGLPVAAVWGNHDFVGEHPNLVPDLPWTLLEDSEVEFEGMRVWGTPWVPGLPRWAFYASDTGLNLRADLIPEGLDVLMSHGPPMRGGGYIGTSPKQRNKYGNYGGIDAGDITLTGAIRRAKPKVTICGHIHEAHGRHWISGNRVLNVAAVTEEYVVREQPWTRIVL